VQAIIKRVQYIIVYRLESVAITILYDIIKMHEVDGIHPA